MDSGYEDQEVLGYSFLGVSLEELQGHLSKPLTHKEMAFLKETVPSAELMSAPACPHLR